MTVLVIIAIELCYASAALFLGHSTREAVKAAAALCCKVAEPIVEEVMERL